MYPNADRDAHQHADARTPDAHTSTPDAHARTADADPRTPDANASTVDADASAAGWPHPRWRRAATLGRRARPTTVDGPQPARSPRR
jgi:hypothetical protein